MSEPALSADPALTFARRLEELLQQGDPDGFLREVAEHSDSAADLHWDVLAVVDQLYRRRKLSPQLFRLARIGIERRALGFHDPARTRSDMPVDRRNMAQPQPQPQAEPQLESGPRPGPLQQAANAERDLELMRAQLARAQVEAVAQRERAQRLEQQLAQRSQLQQKPPEAPLPRRSHPTQPQRMSRMRRFWLIGAGSALAALASALVLKAMLSGTRHGAMASAAIVASEATPATAGKPAIRPGTAAVAAPPGELAFAAERYVVNPEDRQVVVTVRRVAGSAGEVAVEWHAAGAGARAGHDFLVPVPATLIMRDQQDVAQIIVPILRNPNRKHTEYFDLRLVRATGGAVLGQQRRATVFLLPGAGGPRPATAGLAGK